MSGDALRWPAEVSAEVDRLHAEIMGFGQELRDQLFAPGDGSDTPLFGQPRALVEWYHKVWRPFMGDWTSFREWHADSFWQNLPLSGSWESIQGFRQKFSDLDKAARARGFKVMALPPTPPKHDPDITGDLAKTLKTVLIVTGAGVGLVLAATAVSKLGGRRSSPSPTIRIDEPRRLALPPPPRRGG